MTSQILNALITVLIGVGGCIGYFYGSNILLDKLLPADASNDVAAVRNLKASSQPSGLGFFLARHSCCLHFILYFRFFRHSGFRFMTRQATSLLASITSAGAVKDTQFRQSIFNNLLWLLVVPAACTLLGLIIAVLTDRIWWGNLARSLIFLPLAISFVGASVIWKFVYDYREKGQQQIGILNSIVEWFGGDPQVWISMPFWNNFFLMIILVWIQTGFATVILGAALRGVPEDTLEAALIDGAGPFKIFYRIMVPQIMTTIVVVWTTITVLVLKVFDIVLTMTNGQWDTQVLANLMFDWMFRGGGDFGRGAAIAIVIMLAVLPIMIWNIRQANAEQKGGH